MGLPKLHRKYFCAGFQLLNLHHSQWTGAATLFGQALVPIATLGLSREVLRILNYN